jgi:DNA-binding MarR family transcriptional regulator
MARSLVSVSSFVYLDIKIIRRQTGVKPLPWRSWHASSATASTGSSSSGAGRCRAFRSTRWSSSRRVAALGERKIAEEIGRFGLKVGEFDVLAALRRAGTSVTPTELYRSLMLSSGGMTHRIDRLESAGLVERREDERDRRGYRIALTRKGRELIEKAVVAHVENEERLLAALGKSERDTLNGLLRKLLQSLGA